MMETITEFAGRIKKRYPIYADKDDEDLAQRILLKFPEYRSRIEHPAEWDKSPAESPSPAGDQLPDTPPQSVPSFLIGGTRVPKLAGNTTSRKPQVVNPLLGAAEYTALAVPTLAAETIQKPLYGTLKNALHINKWMADMYLDPESGKFKKGVISYLLQRPGANDEDIRKFATETEKNLQKYRKGSRVQQFIAGETEKAEKTAFEKEGIWGLAGIKTATAAKDLLQFMAMAKLLGRWGEGVIPGKIGTGILSQAKGIAQILAYRSVTEEIPQLDDKASGLVTLGGFNATPIVSNTILAALKLPPSMGPVIDSLVNTGWAAYREDWKGLWDSIEAKDTKERANKFAAAITPSMFGNIYTSLYTQGWPKYRAVRKGYQNFKKDTGSDLSFRDFNKQLKGLDKIKFPLEAKAGGEAEAPEKKGSLIRGKLEPGKEYGPEEVKTEILKSVEIKPPVKPDEVSPGKVEPVVKGEDLPDASDQEKAAQDLSRAAFKQPKGELHAAQTPDQFEFSIYSGGGGLRGYVDSRTKIAGVRNVRASMEGDKGQERQGLGTELLARFLTTAKDKGMALFQADELNPGMKGLIRRFQRMGVLTSTGDDANGVKTWKISGDPHEGFLLRKISEGYLIPDKVLGNYPGARAHQEKLLSEGIELKPVIEQKTANAPHFPFGQPPKAGQPKKSAAGRGATRGFIDIITAGRKASDISMAARPDAGPMPLQISAMERLGLATRLIKKDSSGKWNRTKYNNLLRKFGVEKAEHLTIEEAEVVLDQMRQKIAVNKLNDETARREATLKKRSKGGLNKLYEKIMTPIRSRSQKALDKLGADQRKWLRERDDMLGREAEIQRPGLKLGNVFTNFWRDMPEWFDALGRKTGLPFDLVGHRTIKGAQDAPFDYFQIVQKFNDLLPKEESRYTRKEKEDAMALADKDMPQPEKPSKASQELARAFETVLNDPKFTRMVQITRFFDWFEGRPGSRGFEADAIRKQGKGWLNNLSRLYAERGIDAVEAELKKTKIGLISRGYFTHAIQRDRNINRGGTGIDSVGNRSLARIEDINKNDRDPIGIFMRHLRGTTYRYNLKPALMDLNHLYNENRGLFKQVGGKDPVFESLMVFSQRAQGKQLPGAGGQFIKSLVGTMLEARLMLPDKIFRNKLQNMGYDPRSIDFIRNSLDTFAKLSDADKDYFARYVSQQEGIRKDQLFQGKSKFRKMMKKVDLYPWSDESNRMENYSAHLPTIRKAMNNFREGKITSRQLYDKTLMWFLFPQQQARALRILANEGTQAAGRYVAGEVCRKVHFPYARFLRSPPEQTTFGEIFFNLMTYPKGAVKRHALSFMGVKNAPTLKSKIKAGMDLPLLLGKVALAGLVFKKVTGREDSDNPYSVYSAYKSMSRGGALVTLPKETAQNLVKAVQFTIKGNIHKATKEVDGLGRTFLPLYETICRGVAVTTGQRYDGVVHAVLSGVRTRRGAADRSPVQSIQTILFGGNPSRRTGTSQSTGLWK